MAFKLKNCELNVGLMLFHLVGALKVLMEEDLRISIAI